MHIDSIPRGGRVLLVDDLVDSGVTLTRVIAHLKQRFTAIAEVRKLVGNIEAAETKKTLGFHSGPIMGSESQRQTKLRQEGGRSP